MLLIVASCIVVEGLEKSYGALPAVRGVSFCVEQGEVFALLGPNGAGKTTTVEILEGHRRRSGGRVEVLGLDPEAAGRGWRARIGVVLQHEGIEKELTVHEALTWSTDFYAHPRPVAELLELVGLTGKRSARVKTLSGGQRRSLDLALGLVGDPDLIFLDEPTTGFDPEARRQAWDMLTSLRSLGKTVLLTTHYMDEVQYLADRVAVMSGGRIVASGPPASLGGRDTGLAVVSFRLPAGSTIADLPDLGGVQTRGGLREVRLTTQEPTQLLLRLTTWAVGRGEELEALTVMRPSLEDVYLDLVTEPGLQPTPVATAPLSP
jgi:ABC-2 type transport system ATP-binding protein